MSDSSTGQPTGAAAADAGSPAPDGSAGEVIRNRSVLDLTGLSTPEQLAGIAAIEQVGTVLVPRSLAAAYTTIPSRQVGTSIFVPDGATARLHTGTLSVGGDALGAADDALIVTGMLVVTSPVTGELPGLIHVTGTVLVPRGSEAAIGKVLEGTGAVSSYRWAEGQEIRTMAGQISISGATLANAIGEPDDVLVLVGQIVVTGAVGDVGYRQIIVAGQAAMPVAAQDAIEPRVVTYGQIAWYSSASPRFLAEDTELSAEYLNLLTEPTSLIVAGRLRLTDDVSAELLKEKLTDIVVFGEIVAPAALVPVLQFLAVHAFGPIRGEGGSTE